MAKLSGELSSWPHSSLVRPASTYEIGFADTRSTGPFGITNLIFLRCMLRLIRRTRPPQATQPGAPLRPARSPAAPR
jgi:hypothetical protein